MKLTYKFMIFIFVVSLFNIIDVGAAKTDCAEWFNEPKCCGNNVCDTCKPPQFGSYVKEDCPPVEDGDWCSEGHCVGNSGGNSGGGDDGSGIDGGGEETSCSNDDGCDFVNKNNCVLGVSPYADKFNIQTCEERDGCLKWESTNEFCSKDTGAERCLEICGSQIFVNRMPVIESISNDQAFIGQEFKARVIAKDPGDSLIYSLVVSGREMKINGDTGEITWDPEYMIVGRKDIKVQVKDSRGLTTERDFVITVRDPSTEENGEIISAAKQQPQNIDTTKLPPLPRAKPGIAQNSGFDFDNNGKIEFTDFLAFMNSFGSSSGDSNFNLGFDADNNGKIEFADFIAFSANFGKDVPVQEQIGNDGVKLSLVGCDLTCSDPDGCLCSDSCRIKGEIGLGGTCDGEESFWDVFRRTKKEVKNTCNRNLKKGERCEVEFEFDVLGSKGETLDLDVEFKWKGQNYIRRANLLIGDSSAGSGSDALPITGRAISDITGNVIGQNLVTNHGRSRCEIVTPEKDPTLLRTCCPDGFVPFNQDGLVQCTKKPEPAVAKPQLQEKSKFDQFMELAQKYLTASEEEKLGLREALEDLN
jgi:hypothetical protein